MFNLRANARDRLAGESAGGHRPPTDTEHLASRFSSSTGGEVECFRGSQHHRIAKAKGDEHH